MSLKWFWVLFECTIEKGASVVIPKTVVRYINPERCMHICNVLFVLYSQFPGPFWKPFGGGIQPDWCKWSHGPYRDICLMIRHRDRHSFRVQTIEARVKSFCRLASGALSLTKTDEFNTPYPCDNKHTWFKNKRVSQISTIKTARALNEHCCENKHGWLLQQ